MKQKIIKIIISLFMIFSVSINTLAAIVSDNDGSAFVTKAEFDSMKEGFASQIDNYFDSINSKIDGAIGSYLAGIKLEDKLTNLYDQFIHNTGSKPQFLQTLNSGTASVSEKWNMSSKTEIYANVCNNLKYNFCWMEYPVGECSTHTLNTHIAVTCGTHGYDPYTGFDNRRISNDGGQEYTHSSAYATADINPTLSYSPHGTAASNARYTKKSYSKTAVTQQTGTGSGWIYQILNGKKILKYYCTQLYPQYDTLIESHYYASFGLNNAYYFTSNGKSLTPSWAARSVTAEYGKTKSIGNRKSSTDESSDSFAQIKTSVVKTTDGANYMNSIFSATDNWTIYCYDEDYNGGGAGTTEKSVTGETLTWYDTYYTGFGGKTQTNTLTGATGKFKDIIYSPETKHISDFSNNTLSLLSGIDVYQGGGMPMLKANSQDTTATFKIKLKSVNGGSKNINIRMSNKPFKLGNVDTSSNGTMLVNETIQTNVEKTYTVDLETKDQCLWVFVKNNTDNEAIIIDSFELT